ncbi:MAG: GIY-YIG nuclease family protein [bacterium]
MNRVKKYWVYILQCGNGSYYTGFTTDMHRRYSEHVAGSSKSKYTRSFGAKRLLQCWRVFDNRSHAMKLEAFIKGMRRKEKTIIINKPASLKHLFLDGKGIDVKMKSGSPFLLKKR